MASSLQSIRMVRYRRGSSVSETLGSRIPRLNGRTAPSYPESPYASSCVESDLLRLMPFFRDRGPDRLSSA